MDKVRFGRALGYGARHAAKSLMQAVDAATSPDPAAASAPDLTARRAGTSAAERAVPAQPNPAQRVGSSRFEQTRQTVAETARQARQAAPVLRRSVAAPLTRFSSVLWLEVTGTFFTVFALFLAQGVWRLRGAVRLPPSTHAAQQLYLHVGIFLVFAYFAVSSFVRARQRGRK